VSCGWIQADKHRRGSSAGIYIEVPLSSKISEELSATLLLDTRESRVRQAEKCEMQTPIKKNGLGKTIS
jgi:hypothetical protein